MLNKDNIIGIINDHQKKINDLNSEIEKSSSAIAITAMQNELSFLCDNQYRYKLQAKAWKLIDNLD